MEKIDKKKLILTSIITLLPILVGVLLWSKLPDQMATHFDGQNQANGWSSKAFTVFGLPLILLGTHFLVIFFTANDPRKQNITRHFTSLIYWIVPVTSLVVFLSTYCYALDIKVNINLIVSLLMGVLFIVIGNYLPKCKQTYTVGIRLPWTLADEENWNRTHKFSGWLWILAGIIFIIGAFVKLPMVLMLIAIMVLCVGLPMIYSFLFYWKKEHTK